MIDQEILTKLDIGIQEDSTLFFEMVDKVVKEQSSQLDYLMEDLREAVTKKDAIDTDALERYYAELSNMIYFLMDKVERLNVFADLSKAQMKESYNMAYLEFSSEKDEKGKSLRTVNENTSLAESKSKYDSILNTVYDHAYKTLRSKIDMALEMVNTLKNILKRRIQEEYISFSMSNLKNNIEDEQE